MVSRLPHRVQRQTQRTGKERGYASIVNDRTAVLSRLALPQSGKIWRGNPESGGGRQVSQNFLQFYLPDCLRQVRAEAQLVVDF